MDSLIIYFLPTLLALGIVTSYEDIKEGKIRNKYVIAGLVLSVLIHSLLLLFRIIDIRYVLLLGVYVLIALVLGVFLWFIGAWSAGDAKLYVCYIALIPLGVYRNLAADFPIFTLLVNTILPVFFYLLIKMLIKTSSKHKLKAVKKMLNWKYILTILLVVFSIGWITDLVLGYLGVTYNFLYSLLGIIILFKVFQKVFKKKTMIFLVILSIIRIFLNTEEIFTPEFLIGFTFMVLLFAFVRLLIWELGEVYLNKVNIYKLQEGMILAEGIDKKGFKTKRSQYGYSVIDDADKFIYKPSVEGLTKKDIRKIQKAHNRGLLHFNNIKVQQTTPFAPFMFLGVIITIILEGNLLVFFRLIF
jgi:Flp pilus assembly protein protease CpaA